MRLDDVRWYTNARVVRDGEFQSLGFVIHHGLDLLAYLDDAKFLDPLLKNPAISCVVTTEALCDSLAHCNLGLVISEDPRRDFYELHNYLCRETSFYWDSFESEVAPSAVIHPTAYIAPRDVRMGENVLVEPRAVILPHAIIGNDVAIRAGAVIGAEGFEFKRFGDSIVHVEHAGGVLLRDRAEIQSNTCVIRAVFRGFTEIGEDSKIDTLVHVAHNVKIGKRCLIVSHAMLGGSATIGDDVWVGPNAAISSGVTVGDGAFVTLGSVVTKDVEPGRKVTGNFAIDHDRFLAFLRSIR